MGKPPQQLPGEPTAQLHVSDGASERSELLANWLDAHGDALYRFAMQKLHDEHVAADVLQETFLAAFQGAASFRGDSQVRTWLFSILRLKIIDWQRRTHRQSRTLEQMSERATPTAFRQNVWKHGQTSRTNLESKNSGPL